VRAGTAVSGRHDDKSVTARLELFDKLSHMHRVLTTLLAASACSCGTVPEPPSPTAATKRNEGRDEHTRAPRAHFALSELADARTDENFLDPMSLEEWRVDAPGPDLIEIYAADADPDELIAELLPRDEAWLSKSSEVDVVSGRLVAPSRSTAVDALAKAIGTGGRHVKLPLGRDPSISVRLVRESLGFVARTISERAGTNVMLGFRRPLTLSILASRAAPDVLLREIAKLADADLSVTARGWLLHKRDGGEVARVAAMGGPVVDVAFDRVGAGEAIALLAMVTAVPRRATRPCGGPEKSGQVATTRMGLVLAWLVADWPRGRDEPCQLPLWQGNPPVLRAELAGIAWYSPTRAAALLRFGKYDFSVIRPGQNGRARAVIGPTSIEVYENGRSIFEKAVEPEPRPTPLQTIYSRLPPIEPDHWRLAATVREGSSWRALLMHTSLEWQWISDRDPTVRRIERDRVVLEPLRAGGPATELRLARLPEPAP
jgi:hypothetical protein